eukprot:scaffold74618_cov67-Phaeocystis_antarctica.AAC.5
MTHRTRSRSDVRAVSRLLRRYPCTTLSETGALALASSRSDASGIGWLGSPRSKPAPARSSPRVAAGAATIQASLRGLIFPCV